MKVGVIGVGGMGSTHNMSLKQISTETDLQVTAIADVRKEFLYKACDFWPDAVRYENGMDLIDKEKVDLVYICVPSYLHTQMAVAAMKKGINAFIEKPVCLTEEECRLLEKTAAESKSLLMVGQVVRSTPAYVYLKKLADEKPYGKLKNIVMQRISGNVHWGFEEWFQDPVKSGSVALDLHIHDTDFLRYMLGEPEIKGVYATRFDSGMVNHIVTHYQFGDVAAVAEGVWHQAVIPFRSSYRADFDKATVDFNSKEGLVVYPVEGEPFTPDLGEEEEKKVENGMNISSLGSYLIEDRDFIHNLELGRGSQVAPLSEGIASVRTVLRELEQIGGPGPVRL